MNIKEENNLIKILGVVDSEPKFSHEVYGESFYNFKISVKRLSEVSDTLIVAVSERLIDINVIKEGIVLEVTGQIRSYNNYTMDIRENKLILNVFAREIEIVDEEELHKHNNEVEITGFICKSPVYRSTPFGREITDVLLAVNRHYNKSDYIPCIVWGKNAKFVSKLEVGTKLKVWGRLQSRTYQKKLDDGEVIEKNAFEMSISKMEVFKEDNNNENDDVENFDVN